MEVRRARFFILSRGGVHQQVLIALLNEGCDIPPPIYWQDPFLPVHKAIIHNRNNPRLQTSLMREDERTHGNKEEDVQCTGGRGGVVDVR